MPTHVQLSERSRFLLRFLAAAAAEGRESPTNIEIRDAMAAAGHQPHARVGDVSRSDVVGYELARLCKAGLLTVIGAQRYRVFEIVETGARTTRRGHFRSEASREAAAERKRQAHAASQGWPKVTKESAAAYDRAVKRKAWGAPNRQSGEAPLPARSVQPGYAASLTGCAADMVAAA